MPAVAPKLLLPLCFSLLLISQVSSDSKTTEEYTSHGSQALHVFNRGGYRTLMMQNFVLDISKVLKGRISPHALAPAPAPAPVPVPVPVPNPNHLDCGGQCKRRCSLHSRQNICLRACGTCCVRCKCVPPGTFGNREMCGKCYTDMVTHGNKTKCP